MTTRSTRIAIHRALVGRDAASIYTVPPGSIAIVKSALITNFAASLVSVQLYFASVGSTVTPFLVRKDFASNETLDLQFWHVLLPGDQIQESTSGGIVDFWISGAVLPEPG